jgi:hypothetical protein
MISQAAYNHGFLAILSTAIIGLHVAYFQSSFVADLRQNILISCL